MPLVRRKQVAMHSLPPEIIDSLSDTRDVFYLEETGEIFLDYESYASRMSFYKMKVFQCETTGKGGLDYFQALHSEQTESSNLLARFPEPLKVAVLRSVQWRIVGRLDSLVDQVYDRYVDRYHAGEKIFVDIQGEKYWARILKVFPPKALVATWSAYNGNNVSSSANPNALTPSRPQPNGLSPLNPNYTNPSSPSGSNHYSPYNEHPPAQVDPTSIAHRIGGDLSLPPNEALAKDDPSAYFYQVQLIEEGDEDDLPEANGAGASSSGGTKWAGSTMEVQMGVMSRDRLAFSKSILRRFIRECVTRDAAIASPWIVKPALATKYGLETEMPSAMRKSMERAKAGELEKRKKVWEDKEDRPSKKVKKQGDGGDDSGRATPVGKPKETPTPAPVRRYPIEDLDVVLTDRDRKASSNRTLTQSFIYQVAEVPFGEWGPGACEKFLMVWSILTTFGKPLQLSFFTMDEFEQALNHAYTPPTQSKFPRAVPLMAEIHSTLLTHICDRADKPASWSWDGKGVLYDSLDAQAEALQKEYDKLAVVMPSDEAEAQAYTADIKQFAKFGGSEEEVQAHVWRTKLGGIKPVELNIEELRDSMTRTVCMNPDWRSGAIGDEDERVGWEIVLLGCLAEYATPETFPRVRSIVGQLLETTPIVAKPTEQSDAPKIATLDDPDSDSELESANGDDETENNLRWGWMTLTPRDKLELLAFLADLAMTSRGIRSFMDECDARLTTLRKEKIEVNRERKRVAELLEEAGVSVTKMEEKMNGAMNQNGETDEMGDATSEAGSASTTPLPEAGATTRRKSRTAPSSTAPNSHTGTPDSTHPVNQRAAARAQAAEHKGLVKQRQAHIDEAAKLEKQLAEIEREFRQLLGATRMKPLGKDRFHNRIWWFDGIAGVGMGGKVSEGKGNKGKGRAVEKEREREAQGVGRIFLQGSEKGEWEFVMNGRDERAVRARRTAEEGEEYMLEPGEWAMYAEPEQIEEFIAWLNPKGTRELHLKNTMAKWGEPLMAAVGKRSLEATSAQTCTHREKVPCTYLRLPSTMPGDTHNQRTYATPIQATGTPIRYGTPISQGTQLMGTPIPRQTLRIQGGDSTVQRRGSFSGRVRAASLSVRDAIGSYQHSQAQLYGTFLGSPSNASHMRRGADDEEANMSEDGDFTDQEEWSDEEGEYGDYDVDEDQERHDGPRTPDAQHLIIRPGPALSEYGTSPQSILREPGSVASSPDERRLLLTTKVPSYSDDASEIRGRPHGQTFASTASPRTRRLSIISRRKSVSRPPRGSSSYGQTLFNAIAILLGVGMLSEPLAFAYAGWVGGFMLITFYGFLTCYTVVLVVLFSDSMHAVAPQFSSHEYKVLGLIM
ncbi:Imitation switch two complex protein 1 [Rhizoctonia solani AG-1 IB]|uniref:Imitation switch two complex protein 1 n=1 Tax=Thanatephorus cucumeris (strain AG1-IB / isolate 7/3/14) TaxID=1108050 RepID=M5BKH3_THACB|nr:Imitation switch two complex protein 1 [Rhizoctonia solani AG-1 IB]